MIEGRYSGFDVELRPPGIGLITFNHPERLNAMSFGARRDFVEVVSLAQLDDDVRVIVITGTGRGFLAGVNNNAAVAEEPTTVPGRPPAAHEAVNLYAQLVHYA